MSERFGLRVRGALPARTAWRLETDSGLFILKRLRADSCDRPFVAGLHDHLARAAPGLAPRVRRTVDGDAYLEDEGEAYLLLEFLSGREADYLVQENLVSVSAALAQFHRAACGYAPPEVRGTRVLYGRWPSMIACRLSDLQRYRALAEAGASRFDRAYLALWPCHIRQALGAAEGFAFPAYAHLSAEASIAGEICHHDLAHRNILLDGDNVRFLDLDYAVADTVVHDLANLSGHLLQLLLWDLAPIRSGLASYWQDARPNEGALFVLGIMLLWPQEYWQVGRQYYDERQPWTEEEFLDVLHRKCGRPMERLVFLRAYWREYRLAEIGLE